MKNELHDTAGYRLMEQIERNEAFLKRHERSEVKGDDSRSSKTLDGTDSADTEN